MRAVAVGVVAPDVRYPVRPGVGRVRAGILAVHSVQRVKKFSGPSQSERAVVAAGCQVPAGRVIVVVGAYLYAMYGKGVRH